MSLHVDPCLAFESEFYKNGINYIAGTDEAGRGALCGPVVAAAVILPEGVVIPGVDDSKKLSPKTREILYTVILKTAVSVAAYAVRADVIDQINVLQATRRAMKTAIERLRPRPQHILSDAVDLSNQHIPFTPLIKGDQRSHTIAAASIIAKVLRDRILRQWSRHYPEYNLDRNKGYGTAEHLQALRIHGPSPIHRKSYKGVYDWKQLF